MMMDMGITMTMWSTNHVVGRVGDDDDQLKGFLVSMNAVQLEPFSDKDVSTFALVTSFGTCVQLQILIEVCKYLHFYRHIYAQNTYTNTYRRLETYTPRI